MSNLKDTMLSSLITHAEGMRNMHISNVKIYLENPVGIGEHSNIMESIEKELDSISKYEEQIQVIEKFFNA
jgi:hypothetical protein|tara:strand:+ start:263 stop:475 length:213 start_codon:yes stop_codon:yes gene_type:complete